MVEPRTRSEHPGLRIIAVIKLLKALLLVLAAFGSFRLLNHDIVETARLWARHLSIDPENRLVRLAINEASRLEPGKLRTFGEWSLFFAADQVAEGIGLWYNQAWAKYLLLIATPFLFCYESARLAWELIHHKVTTFHAISVPTTAAILVYLILIFRADLKRERSAAAAS